MLQYTWDNWREEEQSMGSLQRTNDREQQIIETILQLTRQYYTKAEWLRLIIKYSAKLRKW